MKKILEQLRDEIAHVTVEQAAHFPNQPPVFPSELIERVAAYVRDQGTQGKTMTQCSLELDIPQNRLHYWLYGKSLASLAPIPAAALRPVQVSAQTVPVYDGVRERRYVLRSPAGWELCELTLDELTHLLQRLL